MKIDVKKFIQTYKTTKRKMDKKFLVPIFIIALIYSVGFDKYSEKPIYHVFMVGICSIICACWRNKSHVDKDE